MALRVRKGSGAFEKRGPKHKPSSATKKITTKNNACIKLSLQLYRIFTVVFVSHKLYLVAQLRISLPFPIQVLRNCHRTPIRKRDASL